jgi:hypothetical protein
VSQPSTSPNSGGKKRRFKNSNIWIAISFLFSLSIIGWEFTSPFRLSGKPLVSSKIPAATGEQFDLADLVQQHRTNAQECRRAALVLDQEFMRSVEENRKRRPVPGIKETYMHRNRHVEAVQVQLRQLRNAPQGSPEWLYKQELLEALEEGGMRPKS